MASAAVAVLFFTLLTAGPMTAFEDDPLQLHKSNGILRRHGYHPPLKPKPPCVPPQRKIINVKPRLNNFEWYLEGVQLFFKHLAERGMAGWPELRQSDLDTKKQNGLYLYSWKT
jgi:hypothetical protein